MKTSVESPQFLFGIYPGGAAGSDDGVLAGPPDDPAHVEEALRLLQGNAQPFIIRAYERYSDADEPSRWPQCSPNDYEKYVQDGRRLDLVVMFQSKRGDVEGYLDYVRALIRECGKTLYSIQITEEANFVNGPDAIDGPYPNVREALVRGVIAAKEEARRLGSDMKVGFNSTPTFGLNAEFWSSIGALGGKNFIKALDYVGLDFFPDVFRPVAPDGEAGDLRESVIGVLETMRNDWLPAAGIPHLIPIHVAEHGWPTGPGRSDERQSISIEIAIRTIYEIRERLNIVRYMMFDLRDADSSKQEFFYQFGLMRDDYTSKPAFATYRKLIAELSS